MEVLAVAQTIYYFSASLAIIVIGVFCAIVSYHLIYIAKRLRHISNNLDGLSDELKEKIESVVDKLSALPILSYFLKKDEVRANTRVYRNKGRKT